jgi:hypothetical protein
MTDEEAIERARQVNTDIVAVFSSYYDVTVRPIVEELNKRPGRNVVIGDRGLKTISALREKR